MDDSEKKAGQMINSCITTEIVNLLEEGEKQWNIEVDRQRVIDRLRREKMTIIEKIWTVVCLMTPNPKLSVKQIQTTIESVFLDHYQKTVFSEFNYLPLFRNNK